MVETVELEAAVPDEHGSLTAEVDGHTMLFSGIQPPMMWFTPLTNAT
jgi:hypothetical protein